LDDAEALSRAHPRSFFIPAAERRYALRPDDRVRLVFLRRRHDPGEPNGERMWLANVRPAEGGRYVGVLTNAPVYIEDLASAEEIEFGPEHIIDVIGPGPVQESFVALTSSRLLEDDTLIPGFVYQDLTDLDRLPLPDGTRASGWCLLVGDETDEEVSNPDTVRLPSLTWLSKRYPAFGDLVQSTLGGRQYVWDHQRAAYVDIGPYEEADDD
jgi:hypothetical protein